MPVPFTTPGAYVQEVPSGVRAIAGVPTSIAAFVGYTLRGDLDRAVPIHSWGDFERHCGGLHRDSAVAYAVWQYFVNGGGQAVVVRVADGAVCARWVLHGGTPAAPVLEVSAHNPGAWANGLRLAIDHETQDPDVAFNLSVWQGQGDDRKPVPLEMHRDLRMDPASPRYVESVVNSGSQRIRVQPRTALSADLQVGQPPAGLAFAVHTPQRPTYLSATDPEAAPASPGLDGTPPDAARLLGSAADKTGLQALQDVDLFNLLVVPDTFDMDDMEAAAVVRGAALLAEQRRAFYIVDAPSGQTLSNIVSWTQQTLQSAHAAVYFPAVLIPDPLDAMRPRAIAPSGTLAGVMALTDAQHGVWRAPAGVEASLRGVTGLAQVLSDGEQAVLNPQGVNALRNLGSVGLVAWGARTLKGADHLADEFRYVPVRRLASHIEESLYRGLQWVAFEPNHEPLWAQIRLNVGAFMQQLFRRGAFQGKTPQQAYFVQCDRATMTADDIDQGIVNVLVGFAPLKPAEFVILKLTQVSGDAARHAKVQP